MAPAPKPCRIRVVDDEPEVRRLLVQILIRKGHATAEATNGKEALAAVRAHDDIGIMVTDLVMPEAEGLETIRACRSVRPDMKIIAISGAFGGEFLAMASRLGADATLPKPIRPEAFIAAVQQLVG